MTFKMKYEIIPRYLPGTVTAPSVRRSCLPIHKVHFMVAHDTGNPSSTASGNVAYYTRSAYERDQEASAHLFVDDKEIIECIPFLTSDSPEKAWHVQYNTSIDNMIYGFDANDAAGGIELCYGGSINLSEAYTRYVWVMAYACYRFGLDPVKHITGHYILDPTRKVDPKNAFSLLCISFDDFIQDVASEYRECTMEEQKMLEKGVAETIINTWISPAWFKANGNNEQQDYLHWLANELRKAAGTPND
ncbi:peptidoglycan recognition protein family protein [Paenibacillus sp. UNC451MF]|uniref:peptidoglycan recognition protein family protein n=1 Tax=Paenibacillus sp. UNC451MF TaxID=1449063 RepID=UPI00048F4955|nr:peptidoglycan recognition family protein [Paenibacillus sp. UNC451MF]